MLKKKCIFFVYCSCKKEIFSSITQVKRCKEYIFQIPFKNNSLFFVFKRHVIYLRREIISFNEDFETNFLRILREFELISGTYKYNIKDSDNNDSDDNINKNISSNVLKTGSIPDSAFVIFITANASCEIQAMFDLQQSLVEFQKRSFNSTKIQPYDLIATHRTLLRKNACNFFLKNICF